jgi:hypothetical protein
VVDLFSDKRVEVAIDRRPLGRPYDDIDKLVTRFERHLYGVETVIVRAFATALEAVVGVPGIDD